MDNKLQVVIWDVQHGSAAYIKTPKPKHFAIDLGVGTYSGKNGVFSPLLHLKNKYRLDHLDKITITHPHTDHIDDIFNFDELSPRVFHRPSHLTEEDIKNANPSVDAKKIEKYLEIDKRYKSPIPAEMDPSSPNNNGGVNFYYYAPKKCSTSNINNHSIVTIIEYLKVKIIIPGDNERESWDELLADSNFVNHIKNCSVFVASHHGRESGFSSKLFEVFKPKITIVSDGAETDTSAVDRYSKNSIGWDVYKRSGGIEKSRKCLTTRNDGLIIIEVGENSDRTTCLKITID